MCWNGELSDRPHGANLSSLPNVETERLQNGSAPSCPYGYFDAAPYGCAPAGYYGPEWFNGAVFIGAGPWFHKGATPARGEKSEPAKRVDKATFKGNEERDGHGKAVDVKH